MAQYRLEAQIIGRGAGRSAIAAAAYRSGETIVDRARGVVHDYTSRHGVRMAEVIVPTGTPALARADLWNTIEGEEKRADGQLARELLLACPYELSDEQNAELVRGFIAEHLTAHGIVVDWAMHGPDRRGDARHIHAHVLSTVRPYRPDGTFGPKADVRHLNAREQLLRWREAWETHLNRALENANVRERVSAARGLDPERPPEPKVGPLATDMERSGRRTYAGDDRRQARRARERAASRSRSRPSARERVSAVRDLASQLRRAVRGVSLLAVDFARDLIIEHPARDRWWELRRAAQTARERHTPGPRGWRVSQNERTIVYTKGNRIIQNDGARIRVSAGIDAPTAAAAIDVLQANGWTTMRIRGDASPQDKTALILAALQRGIEPVVDDADKSLVQRLRTMSQRGERARDAADREQTRVAARATADRQQAADRAAGMPAGASPGSSGATTVVEETFRVLQQQQSTFTRDDLERALAKFRPDADGLAELLVAAREHPELVELDVDERGRQRFATARTIAMESRFVEDALAKASRRIPGLDMSLRDKIAEAKQLTAHQRPAFDVCTNGRGLVVLRGIAGGGKSYLMGAVREFYEANGKSVHGAALAGVAADGLAMESGIDDSRTIAQWRAYLDHQPALDGSVLILDEAGMAGTEDLNALLRKFDTVILVGDDRQLQPISAGAPFRALVERLPDGCRCELHEVRRQKVDWMRTATKLFYDGRTREALHLYDQNGRWMESPTLTDAKSAIVNAWAKERHEDPTRTQLVLAYTRADVLDLNEQLRAVRRADGELHGPDVELDLANGYRKFAVNENVYFHEPWKAEENGVALKDGAKPWKIRNGTVAIVKAIDAEKNTITVRIPDKTRSVTVDLGKYRSLDYADARTLHTAQGKTVDLAHFLATPHRGVQADLAYVGDSRHRFDMHLYWSRDVFRNKNHVYRTLERFEPKDYSLDFSRDDFHVGFGVPHQAHAGVAVRAPYQIRTEIENVVAMATHLHATAPTDRRAAADRAIEEVRAWHKRIESQIRTLEATGVRGVAIAGTAEDFAARLALIERSVSTAVERVEERERGRANDRFADLRADVVRLREQLTQRRAAATIGPRPQLLPPVATAIAEDLKRLTVAVELAGPTSAERARLGELEERSRQPATRAAAMAELGDLREKIQIREAGAAANLRDAQTRFADPNIRDAMQQAFVERAREFEQHQERSRAAAGILASCDRQEAEITKLEQSLSAIGPDVELTHEQIDALLVDLDRTEPEAEKKADQIER